MPLTLRLSLLLALSLPLVGCPVANDDDSAGDDDDSVANDDDSVGDDDDSVGTPDNYTFPSRLDGTDSVAWSGQTFRHVLIDDMKTRIGGMTDRLDTTWFPADGDVVDELTFYFDFDDGSSTDLDHDIETTPAPLQTTYGDISTGKDLVGKIAGNDATGQHADWSTDFVGWTATGVTTPESLVRHWFEQLEDQAIDWAGGTYPQDPSGANVSAVYITADGTDLQQLLQKFLLGAIAFSQGADDYLDDDTAGKGLQASHDAVEDGKNYTALEHAWDEGVGYFGMTRDYGAWSDADIAAGGGSDTWEVDGSIDLITEKVWGHAINAAKRDNCGDCTNPTDLTKQAWDAFVGGRTYITNKSATLTTEEIAELAVYRDAALDAWEKAIAATVVHYINDTITDVAAWEAGTGDFTDLAKHWSEMKGFALGLQFNRLSPVSDSDFAQVHTLMGQAPDLANASDYQDDLLTARGILATAYGFDPGNVDAW